jgi:hypothetical protein
MDCHQNMAEWTNFIQKSLLRIEAIIADRNVRQHPGKIAVIIIEKPFRYIAKRFVDRLQ